MNINSLTIKAQELSLIHIFAAWLKLVEEIRPRQVMVYSLDRDTPCKTLQKVPREDLQAIEMCIRDRSVPAAR